MATFESSLLDTTRRAGVTLQSNWIRPVTVLGCLLVWLFALQKIDVSRMNDYGLISVMSFPCFLALAVLTISFCITLRDESAPAAILLLHILALMFMLFGITSIVEDVPRFESTWKHVGVADYVVRHGSVDSEIDAYFNWPGFFVLLAFVTEVTGAASPMTFANWAPIAFELLYLPVLFMLFQRVTSDRRLVWLSVWMFYLANWIGQDYLSPQGFNYFLYLVMLAILVTWFGISSEAPHPFIRLASKTHIPLLWLMRLYHWVAPPDFPPPPTQRWQRIGLVLVMLAVFITVTAGHQLTPFATLGAALILVIAYRCRLIGLPVIMAVIAALWLRYLASAYWAGHGSQITGQVGALNDSVGSNMTDRLSGSTGHQNVVYIRTAMTVALWSLALVGMVRRLSKGHRDFTFALLAAAPFPLIAAQSYGGEMLLRVYLFALPFMAFFVAAIFYRSDEVGGSWKTTIVVITISFVALGLFFVTRYGNERQDYFSLNEVAAAEFLYDQAPPDSVIVAGTVKAPWKYRDYEIHKHKSLADELEWISPDGGAPDLNHIADLLSDSRFSSGFLFFTRSQIANDEMFGLIPDGLSALEKRIQDSPDFVLLYENPDARIYILADHAQGDP